MLSANIENLCFAGRNISVTHAALSSSRVMATCSVLGQALGTAVALAVNDGVAPENVDMEKLQQTLMEDDCYIPWHERRLPELTKNAHCTAEIVRNGIERGEENLWVGKKNDFIEYSFSKDTAIKGVRLIFDSDINRRYHNMPCNYPLRQDKFKLPEALIREYKIQGISESGEVQELHITDNRKRFVRLFADWCVKTVRFVPVATHGSEEFRLFEFEIF